MRNVSGILKDEIRKQILNLNEVVIIASASSNNSLYYTIISGYDNPPKECITEEDKLKFEFKQKIGMSLYGNRINLTFDFNWNKKDIDEFINKALLNDNILEAIKNNELTLKLDAINLRKSFYGYEFGGESYKNYSIKLKKLKTNINNKLCLLGLNQSNYNMENIC